MFRKLLLAAVAVATMGTSVAVEAYPGERHDRREIRQDRREMRHDRREFRRDHANRGRYFYHGRYYHNRYWHNRRWMYR